jgi:transcription elongation GreA/GreB family factor
MPENNYELEKFRNSFKSRNTLIDEDFAVKPDTIVSVITNSGDIEELYRIVKNDTIKLKVGQIRYLTKEKMRGLTSY